MQSVLYPITHVFFLTCICRTFFLHWLKTAFHICKKKFFYTVSLQIRITCNSDFLTIPNLLNKIPINNYKMSVSLILASFTRI